METLFWLALGLFIGWNIPQPTWAKIITKRVLDSFQVPKQ